MKFCTTVCFPPHSPEPEETVVRHHSFKEGYSLVGTLGGLPDPPNYAKKQTLKQL